MTLREVSHRITLSGPLLWCGASLSGDIWPLGLEKQVLIKPPAPRFFE